MEDGPDEGLDPVPSTGHYQIEIAGGSIMSTCAS